MSHKKHRTNTLPNMAGILITVGIVSGIALSVVNQLTAGPRAATEKANKIAAIKKVLPAFDNNPSETGRKFIAGENGDIRELVNGEKPDEKEKFRACEVFTATMAGKTIGYAVTSYTEKGYSGKFFIMVGIDPKGAVTDISVIDNKETPGLGTEMAKPKFKDQFKGRLGSKPFSVQKDGGDIDAITAATISSRAFCDAVNRAFTVFSAATGAQPAAAIPACELPSACDVKTDSACSVDPSLCPAAAACSTAICPDGSTCPPGKTCPVGKTCPDKKSDPAAATTCPTEAKR